ncbi:MAG TPA: hypothetical protein VFP37_17620 [Steroidobacteraceae bacterium]|nr:hypothetical protein [Steroidobacteraceae bacterium]
MSDAVPTEKQGKAHRYLAGQMSAGETAEFETEMLEHPETLEDVALLRRMKSGLASLRRNGELDHLLRTRRATRRGYLALAASLVVAAGIIGWQLFDRPGAAAPVFSARQELFAERIGASPPDELLLVRNRSAALPALELPGSSRVVLLRVVTGGSGSAAAFDLELVRASPAPQVSLGRVENLRADAQGMLSSYFDPRSAGAGSFSLLVQRRDPAGGVAEVVEYPFEVRLQ